jgi:anthranilate synthase component 1
VDIFGHTRIPRIVSLDYTGTQFDIYNKISRNYAYSFLFESLTGPEELSETSIMGFDPEFIVKGYYDKVTIQSRDGSIKTISTTEPLNTIKDLVQETTDQSYRYLGGAVAIINYDAIRLWENIPKQHDISEPIMEFGIFSHNLIAS